MSCSPPSESQTFTQALYTLAARPECVAPLREEIEGIVREDGWTKSAVQRMWKLDSFMKESQRFHGLGACTSPVSCTFTCTH